MKMETETKTKTEYYLLQKGKKLYLMPNEDKSIRNAVGTVVDENGQALDVSNKDTIYSQDLEQCQIMVNKKYKGTGTVNINKCQIWGNKENIYKDKDCIMLDIFQVSKKALTSIKYNNIFKEYQKGIDNILEKHFPIRERFEDNKNRYFSDNGLFSNFSNMDDEKICKEFDEKIKAFVEGAESLFRNLSGAKNDKILKKISKDQTLTLKEAENILSDIKNFNITNKVTEVVNKYVENKNTTVNILGKLNTVYNSMNNNRVQNLPNELEKLEKTKLFNNNDYMDNLIEYYNKLYKASTGKEPGQKIEKFDKNSIDCFDGFLKWWGDTLKKLNTGFEENLKVSYSNDDWMKNYEYCWDNFNSKLDKSQCKDVRDLIKRYWLLLNRIMIINPNCNFNSSDAIINNGIPQIEQHFFNFVLESVKFIENDKENDKKIFTEEIFKKFGELRTDLFSAMNDYLNTTGKQRNECWDKIKDIINNQFDMLERKLVNISQNRTQTEDTHEVEAEKEKLEKRGFIKRTAGRVVKFVKDTRDSITKKPVKLTLDTGIVTKFTLMVSRTYCYAQKFNIYEKGNLSNLSNLPNLKDKFKDIFSGSKSTYRSWYNYVYDRVCDIDKCFKAWYKNNKDCDSGLVLEFVQISLMYVFVRSMLHCDLKNVNSIREGIKQFVLTIDTDISSKQNVSAVEKKGKALKEVMQAGTKTRQLCKDVKSNMNEVLARQKSLRDVLKKEECKKILDFITDTTYKNKLKQKIVK